MTATKTLRGMAAASGLRGRAAPKLDETFVTLTLAGQLCGVPVRAVRDVLVSPSITRVPLAPPEIPGSLNLRGRIVTSIDLRRRLGLPAPAPGQASMSLVTEFGHELYALLVDNVREVLSLPADRLEAPPPTLAPAWATVSAGIYRLEDDLMAVLDVPRLLAIGAA